jgi:hypothetical protein
MLMMGDQVDSGAGLESAIATVRELEAALATDPYKPEYQKNETLAEFTRGLRSDLHTTLITLELVAHFMEGASKTSRQSLLDQHQQPTPKDREHVEARKRPQPDQDQQPAPKAREDVEAQKHPPEPKDREDVEAQQGTADRPTFYECSVCGALHPWGPWTPLDCESNGMCFSAEELDKRYPRGWMRRAQSDDGRGRFDPNATPWKRAQRNHHELEQKSSVPSAPANVYPEAQRSTRMREGSNADRIWQATSHMLVEHRTMHVDDILACIEALGLFGESVKDRRIRMSNLLSQYKAKGLVTSDNRGNWSLLNGKGGA